VALTARATSQDRAECLAAGMDDYITKPVHVDRLIEVLGRVTQSAPAEFGTQSGTAAS
jgi:CheY-like chemotaxis protein